MSYFVNKYPAGTFCWADCSSVDPQKTASFMKKLMNWESESIDIGHGMVYTIFKLDGRDVAAVGPAQEESMKAGVPSMWNNYVSVENVDEMTKRAKSLGAKVIVEPMDVFDSGRMAVIADLTGAVVSLWQAKKHIGARVVNTVGAMGWNELYTNDMETSKDFYSKLFGWTFETDDKNAGYTVIFNNGRMNGGIMAITSEMGGMPPKWMTYFSIKSADETAKKVEELGGKVWMVKDIGVGKIVMIQDPAGANFIAIELASQAPAEEWMEGY